MLYEIIIICNNNWNFRRYGDNTRILPYLTVNYSFGRINTVLNIYNKWEIIIAYFLWTLCVGVLSPKYKQRSKVVYCLCCIYLYCRTFTYITFVWVSHNLEIMNSFTRNRFSSYSFKTVLFRTIVQHCRENGTVKTFYSLKKKKKLFETVVSLLSN